MTGVACVKPSQGHVGQLRFSLRKDIDPSSYGSCGVEEIRGNQPGPDDVLLLAKHRMADPEPYRVVCVLSSSSAAALRRDFRQPEGTGDRRPISEKVRKNIEARCPPCVAQGIMSTEASAYLINWCQGSLAKLPRPTDYPFLAWKGHAPDRALPGPRGAWERQGRERHVDLTVHRRDQGSSEEEDALAAIDLEDDE